MPELPEVETIKNHLKDLVLNRKVVETKVYYDKIIKSELSVDALIDKKILDIKRKGKFIIFDFEKEMHLILHLRMEGKLFYFINELDEIPSSASFSLKLDEGYLYFFDTRKFAVAYIISGDDIYDIAPLNSVALDSFEISYKDLYQKIKSDKRMIKKIILDQTLISGIGNIYADEVLFACNISPFAKGYELEESDVKDIVDNAKRIMTKAIELGGSTVKSYQSSQNHSGSFQNELKVYGRVSQKCVQCNSLINKRFLDGRGTSFCPYCQGRKDVLAITGTIGAGKSEVTKIFEEAGYKIYDCDKVVKELYDNARFIKKIEDDFYQEFGDGFSKEKVLYHLNRSKNFKRKYETYIYKIIREDLNQFLIENCDKNILIDAPTYNKASINTLVPTYIFVDADEDLRRKRLVLRGQGNIEEMMKLNYNSKIEEEKSMAIKVILNNGSLDELAAEVKKIIEERKNKYGD